VHSVVGELSDLNPIGSATSLIPARLGEL
jgi:hypothetical protein